MLSNYPQYDFNFNSAAVDGNNSWSNLARLDEVLSNSPDVVIIDHANDSDLGLIAIEAFIRRVWQNDANTQIIIVESPSWVTQDTSDNNNTATPTNLTAVNTVNAIANNYGVALAQYLEWIKSVVPGTYDLIDLVADTVHPTATGYNAMAQLVEAFLPSGGASQPSIMPDYYNAAAADFVYDPQQINGTDYDSRTGTWSDDGTSTSSSDVGATITFNVTCRSFGLYRADVEAGNNGNIEVDINGGGYSAIDADRNGYDIGARDAYAITIKVTGGTVRIDEFWAI